jgi:hypothetical protein
VGAYSCRKAKTLAEVEIPDEIKSIGPGAFSGCENITKVSLGKDILEIGSSAFSSCSKLSTINLPANLKTLADSAFYSCKALKTISIPATIETIGTHSFTSSGLEIVYFGGTEAQWNALKEKYYNYNAALFDKTVYYNQTI